MERLLEKKGYFLFDSFWQRFRIAGKIVLMPLVCILFGHKAMSFFHVVEESEHESLICTRCGRLFLILKTVEQEDFEEKELLVH